jgi:uncharacterized phage-associated protein
MTHLKLQKLAFYCYGAAVAHRVDAELGELTFEPWNHGPVNRSIWQRYRKWGRAELPALAVSEARSYSWPLTVVLGDTVDVYGRMSAWALRCESHLEQPWVDAHSAQSGVIEPEALREHFQQKFAVDRVQLPVHLGGSASAALDFIPPARFPSLHDMAETLRQRAA